MKHKLFWSLVFGLLAVGLLFTSVTLAAPQQPPAEAGSTMKLFQTVLTPTATPTGSVMLPTPTPTGSVILPTPPPTNTFTHPVAAALADYFGVPYAEIFDLHQEGLGFGGIARAYFMAEQLEDVTADELLEQFQSGTGWGQIAKQHGLHPGQNGRGGSVGTVMSGRGSPSDTLQTTESANNHPGRGNGPPGRGGTSDTLQTTESVDTHPGRGNGPPNSPPGQDKKQDKGKGKKK
jgi:hypothetical protein